MMQLTPVDYDPFGGVPRITVTPNRAVPEVGRALLDTIAGSESPGYDVMYGGGRFEDFTDHPRTPVPIRSGPNAGKNSTAAGRYQFLARTWDEVKNEAGLPDFSPESQDIGAWHLASKTYKKKTGRDLEQDLSKVNGNPNAIAGIANTLSGVWTSLPGGIEPNSMTSSFAARYQSPSTDMSAQSRPRITPVDYDPFAEPEGRFTDNPGQNFRTAREGVSEQAKPELPDTFVNRLVELWENPPKDKLSLVGMIKHAYETAKGVGEAAAGDVPIRDESGQINPEIIKRTTNLALIAPMRAAPGGVFGAPVASKVTEQAAPKVAAPTTEALKEAATAGFQSPEVTGLAIRPGAIKQFSTEVRTALNNSALDENLAPKTFSILSKLEQAPEGAIVTGANLQTMRRTFQNAASSPDKTERLAAKRVIDAIDDFIPELAAKDILSGDPKAAAEAWALARGNYAAAMRSEDIAKAVLKAERQASAAGAGANIDNATRQQFKAILNNEKKLRGFSPEEVAQMEQLVGGTRMGNAARLVGKAAPTGIVSGALSGGAGFAAGGPVGAVLLPIAGYIGKKVGDKSTARQVARLDELVRSRAPLAKSMEDFAMKAQAVQQQGQNARTMSALSLSARNLATNLKDAGITLSPTELIKSLRGPVGAGAEQDE